MKVFTVAISFILLLCVSHAYGNAFTSRNESGPIDPDSLKSEAAHEYQFEKRQVPHSVLRFLESLDKPLYSLQPSVPKGLHEGDEHFDDFFAGFNYLEQSFSVPISIMDVWDEYLNVSPINAWNTKSSCFGMAYDKDLHQVYINDSTGCPPAHEDMIFFLKLTPARIVHIPVAFEITMIDPSSKTIEFTYLLENKSHGRQVLEFSSEDDITIIKHSTYYTSGKRIRDKVLYPPLHNKIITDFHQGMFQMITAEP